MNLFFRYFFKTLRFFLEPIILLWNKLTLPTGIQRSPHEQSEMDKKTKNLALYQFNACPFCIKVRRQIKRQSLNIELIDAQYNQQYRKELLEEGGELKAPCLKISSETGDVKWLYESNDIISYLKDTFN